MRLLAANGDGIWLQVDEEHPRPGVTLLSVREGAERVAQELRDRISIAIAAGSHELVVDLSAASSVDAMTVSVLEGAMTRMDRRGGRLRVLPRGLPTRAAASKLR